MMNGFKPGDRVVMSEGLKRLLRKNGSGAHVDEFGNCFGFIECETQYGDQVGPELDVRWFPSGLRYAYSPEYLVKI